MGGSENSSTEINMSIRFPLNRALAKRATQHMVFIVILLVVSGCTSVSHSRVVVCGTTKQGAVWLSARVQSDGSAIKVGELEELFTALVGARCPHQWLPSNYDPVTHRGGDEEHWWFVVGANVGGLGGSVFRLEWQNGHARAEEWFQLPRGDFVIDVIWTKNRGWQALAIGGDPDCGNTQPGNEYLAIRCALQRGGLYLIDTSGNYTQLLKSDGVGRCEAVFNPDGTAIAFRESALCFTSAEQDASSRIVVIDLNDNELWRVPGDGQQYMPYWSPDGTQIAFTAVVELNPIVTSAGDIPIVAQQPQIADVESREIRSLSPLFSNDPNVSCSLLSAPDVWSPDGQKLLCRCSIWRPGDGKMEILGILDISDGNITEADILNPGTDYWSGAAWFDSNTIGWKTIGSRPEFGFLNLESGEMRTLPVEPSHNWTWLRRSPDGDILGLVRTGERRNYIDFFAWHDLTIKTTVELPQGVDWMDLYWISE